MSVDRHVVVLVTNPGRAGDVIAWVHDHLQSRPARLHVVVTGSDNPGAPRYTSPEALRTIDAALRTGQLPFDVIDGGVDAASCALDLIQRTDAELAVCGFNARTATGKLVMGSHARRLVVEAPCPVVTIKHR